MRAIAFIALVLSLAAHAQPLPTASPRDAGFCPERLERIDRFFEHEIAANRVPGAVIAIARDGKLVYYKAFGYLDASAKSPMPLDAMFSLASMTKPMAAVAALTLTEQGRLGLHSRLDQYFPAFAHMQVGIVGPGTDAKPEAAHPIYIQDLFRHTSGLAYGNRGDTPVHKLYPASSAASSERFTSEEFAAKLATLPLLYQPGTVWDYSLSVDLLGVVVEKVVGERLGAYMKSVLFDPLGMTDATFHPSSAQRARLARPLPLSPDTGKPQRIAMLDSPVKFDCAGGCGFATVADYVRFGQMLLNGGILEGHRILGPKTVEMMTTNQLGPGVKNNVASIEGHREGYGFGLTVAVRTQVGVAAIPGSVGDYTWNGANGTGWWNDPAEHLVVVFGTAAPGDIRKYYREQMADLVYAAMEKSYVVPAERVGR